MARTITHDDMTHTRNRNGSVTVSALMPRGYYNRVTFYGYTVRQARQAFYRDVNGL